MKQKLIEKVLAEKQVKTNRFAYKLAGERIIKQPLAGGEWKTAHIFESERKEDITTC